VRVPPTVPLIMPKSKGSGGGNLIAIENEYLYQQIISYLSEQWKIPADWPKEKKRKFRRWANRFEVRNDAQTGSWPHGKVLWMRIFTKTGEIKETKLYVPEWHKQTILQKYHGDDGLAAHFGRNRLYAAINEQHYGITQEDCLNYIQACPGCKVFLIEHIYSFFFYNKTEE